jgi:RimJ/RimL family protein N-acetyltransferase
MNGFGDRFMRELMELHLHTLYRCDADGRLRCVNEVGEPPAPRFYLGRTHQGNLWRFRHDLPAATAAQLDRLCRAEPPTADLARPPQHEAAIRAVLHDHAPLTGEYRGPAYWIAEETPPPANAVLISDANADLLRAGFPWMLAWRRNPAVGPVAAVVEQGQVVAVCFCSRLPGQATEAGVETLAAFRGQGHATAAVAKWAAEVRRQGIIPLYSTAWQNLASQAIARKLKMVLYGEDWSIQ